MASIHHGIGGAIAGVLLTVDVDGQPLHLGLMVRRASQWPPGLAKGDRLWVKGVLRLEVGVWHRKNSHYLDVQHVAQIRRQPRAPERR